MNGRSKLVGACLIAVTAASAQGPPELPLPGIVSAATLRWPDYYLLTPYAASGSILTLFGRNLAAETAGAKGFPLPTELGGLQVLFSGQPALLFYASPSQVNLLVPPVVDTANMEVRNRFGSIRFVNRVVVTPANPGLFTLDGSGCGLPAIYNHRLGRTQQVADVAKPGDVLTLYGTGFGPPYPTDGNPAPLSPLQPAPDPYRHRILFGSENPPDLALGETLWQGKTPGLTGVDQLNVTVPGNAQQGCAVPVRFDNPAAIYPLGRLAPFHLPISSDGVTCEDKARNGFLRLVLVREVNSAVPGMAERRDRLFVNFFATPPPEQRGRPDPIPFLGCRAYYNSTRYHGPVCPGWEGVAEDYLLDTIYDSARWQERVPQDAGTITVGGARLNPGTPSGAALYPTELPVGTLEQGRKVRVSGAGGRHIGPFTAEIGLPEFRVVSNLAPGTIMFNSRGLVRGVSWFGGTPDGVVRWWLSQGECRERARVGAIYPWPADVQIYWPDGNPAGVGTMLLSPAESEEVEIQANGLRYGGRLSFLYVHRFGGLRYQLIQ